MLSLISFFTNIPSKGSLENASKETYLLPIIALIISLPSAIVFYFLFFLPSIIRAVIGILFIYAINGIIHLDGLADFSDGIMVKGPKDKKIKALKDVNTGIAGLFSVLFVILLEIFSLYSIRISLLNVLSFFIISEFSAKFSMSLGLINRPQGEGLGAIFQKNFKKWFLVIAILITLPFFLLFHYYYFFSFVGFLISLIISKICKKNFGMVNGDCLGAMNEISRSITMVVLCSVL
ncbi:MAG: adenosylcobinamide-GDP ribazoletransferase [Thermoplasmata archaeon]|nr:adenosylcobinamide-GDP ribazoletransferase [Thermoplasmata archaeon]